MATSLFRPIEIISGGPTLWLPDTVNPALTHYAELSRRQFLIKSSIVASSASLLAMPFASNASMSMMVGAKQPHIVTNSIGFNGERRDPVLGNYHLGNGYRMYNPGLMRFNSADSMSPFGAGGINPYAYCQGDPVNMIDPTGHMSWQAGLGLGFALLGLIISIATLGAGSGVGAGVAAAGITAAGASKALAITSGALGVASAVTGVASAALVESDPKASEALGWTSLGLGIGSALLGGTAAMAGKIKPITMAGHSRNVRELGPLDVGYIFDDLDSIDLSPRLNLVAHGNPDGTLQVGLGRHESAEGLIARMNIRGIPYRDYPHIRLLVCNSADGEQSLAQRLAIATQSTVTGYHGPVIVEPSLRFLVHRRWSALTLDRNNDLISGINGERQAISYLAGDPVTFYANATGSVGVYRPHPERYV